MYFRKKDWEMRNSLSVSTPCTTLSYLWYVTVSVDFIRTTNRSSDEKWGDRPI